MWLLFPFALHTWFVTTFLSSPSEFHEFCKWVMVCFVWLQFVSGWFTYSLQINCSIALAPMKQPWKILVNKSTDKLILIKQSMTKQCAYLNKYTVCNSNWCVWQLSLVPWIFCLSLRQGNILDMIASVGKPAIIWCLISKDFIKGRRLLRKKDVELIGNAPSIYLFLPAPLAFMGRRAWFNYVRGLTKIL